VNGLKFVWKRESQKAVNPIKRLSGKKPSHDVLRNAKGRVGLRTRGKAATMRSEPQDSPLSIRAVTGDLEKGVGEKSAIDGVVGSWKGGGL